MNTNLIIQNPSCTNLARLLQKSGHYFWVFIARKTQQLLQLTWQQCYTCEWLTVAAFTGSAEARGRPRAWRSWDHRARRSIHQSWFHIVTQLVGVWLVTGGAQEQEQGQGQTGKDNTGQREYITFISLLPQTAVILMLYWERPWILIKWKECLCSNNSSSRCCWEDQNNCKLFPISQCIQMKDSCTNDLWWIYFNAIFHTESCTEVLTSWGCRPASTCSLPRLLLIVSGAEK